ncbi:MAG TPA: hypothetical protein VGD95_06185 [Micavibrio sp.]
MTLTKEQAIENIYLSLQNGNEDIDAHIAALKPLLDGTRTFAADSARLPQNNRQGRKMMQSYFKKRGINVTFAQE